MDPARFADAVRRFPDTVETGPLGPGAPGRKVCTRMPALLRGGAAPSADPACGPRTPWNRVAASTASPPAII